MFLFPSNVSVNLPYKWWLANRKKQGTEAEERRGKEKRESCGARSESEKRNWGDFQEH